jgi:PAS domain-containing protein
MNVKIICYNSHNFSDHLEVLYENDSIMVSQLSVRLLQMSSSSCNSIEGNVGNEAGLTPASTLPRSAPATTETKPRKATTTSRRIPPYAIMPSSASASYASSAMGGASGYLADQDNKRTLPASLPHSIDFLSRPPKRFSVFEQESGSKTKEDLPKHELIYMASTVKYDIHRVGRTIPKINVDRPSTFLKRLNIDISSVTLMHAMPESPVSTIPSPISLLADRPFEFSKVMDGLTQETLHAYSQTDNHPLPDSLYATLQTMRNTKKQRLAEELERQADSSDSESSSTSSFTASDDADANNIDLGNHPRYEGRSAAKSRVQRSLSDVISIGEALSICNHPRYVSFCFFISLAHQNFSDLVLSRHFSSIITGATAPFCVVQVNAAFHRLTGLKSEDILGKPILDLMSAPDEMLPCSLGQCAITLHATILRHQVFKTATSTKSKQQREQKILVSPVGPQPENITHFRIELRDEDESEEPNTATGGTVLFSCTDSPMNVMG